MGKVKFEDSNLAIRSLKSKIGWFGLMVFSTFFNNISIYRGGPFD